MSMFSVSMTDKLEEGNSTEPGTGDDFGGEEEGGLGGGAEEAVDCVGVATEGLGYGEAEVAGCAYDEDFRHGL